MAFLTEYSGTERVKLSEKYWVDVKKCLSRGEMEIAEKLLTSATLTRERAEGNERSVETAGYRTYIVTASIVDWNLDEDDGRIWQLNNDRAKRDNVKRLPESVFDTIHKRVEELNAPVTPEQRGDFREDGPGGDKHGFAGPGDVIEAPNGNDAVVPVWTTPGGSPAPAVP